jgi:hypothetical protein
MAVFGASRPLPQIWRTSLDRTDSRRSALATGTGLHAPQQSFLSPVAAVPLGWNRSFPTRGAVDASGTTKIRRVSLGQRSTFVLKRMQEIAAQEGPRRTKLYDRKSASPRKRWSESDRE